MYIKQQVEIAIEMLKDYKASMANENGIMLMTAIGFQESRFLYRRQIGGGPARGFWQFEKGGVEAVLKHSVGDIARDVMYNMSMFGTDADYIMQAIEYNDVLAAVFARLLLFTNKKIIPTFCEANKEALWKYYLETWRPGKPRPETWDKSIEIANLIWRNKEAKK
jgi:hypothetical protein